VKVGILSLIFLLFCVSAFGNNTDSLENELNNADDSLTASIYYKLILTNEYSNPKKAIYYSRLTLSHPLNQNDEEQSKALINLGFKF